MNIVFMGTPDFAVPALQALIDKGHNIKAVVTMPDKAKGRGYELQASPVKIKALENNLQVLTPNNLKDDDIYQYLLEVNADIFVVVAYGHILPKRILDIPRLASINIHASLLPAYRGAAPIQWAIIDGLKQTGITTMIMDTGLDTGDILKQYTIDIDENETGGSLFEKLSKLGAMAIIDTIDNYDVIEPIKQGETNTMYAKMLNKSMGQLDFTKSAVEIERLVRALNPWPSAYTYLDGKIMKIWKAKVSDKLINKNCSRLLIEDNKMFVACKDKYLEILQIQLEGKKKMDIASFLRGYKVNNIDTL